MFWVGGQDAACGMCCGGTIWASCVPRKAQGAEGEEVAHRRLESIAPGHAESSAVQLKPWKWDL